MKIRGLDANGDWMFGQGVGSYAQNQAAIALDVAMRLRLWYGSCFFAPTSGVDYKNLLGPGQQQNIQTAITSCILQTPGVVKINSIRFKFNALTRALSVSADVQTVFTASFIANINNLIGTVAGNPN